MKDEEQRETETGEMQAEEAEMMQRLQEEIRNLPVAEHVVYMMHSLSTLAIGRMGLSPDAAGPKDLAQARLAIDAFKALLEVVERSGAGQVAAHRGMLAQLQLAYVGVLDEAKPHSQAPAEAEAPAAEPEVPAGEPKAAAAEPEAPSAEPEAPTAEPEAPTAEGDDNP